MRLGRGFPLPFAYHHLIAWISAAILAIKAATNFAISYGVGFFCLPLILCRTSFPVVIILYHQNGDMSMLFFKVFLLFCKVLVKTSKVQSKCSHCIYKRLKALLFRHFKIHIAGQVHQFHP